MIKKCLIASIVLLLSLSLAHAATINGIIYDLDLNPAKDSVIKVNTVPEQTYVAKDGSYSFVLPVGEYILEVNHQSSTAEQSVTIKDEGSYIVDIILFPDISEEQNLLDEDIEVENILDEENSNIIPAVILIIILSLTVIVYIYSKKKKPKTEIETDISEEALNFIKKQGNRVTQKELRKQFPLSEAKISLIVTELEEKGLIRKIKRGRGNVIILNKSQ